MCKHLRDSIEEKQPLLVRRQLRKFRKRTETGFNLRCELGNLRSGVAECVSQCRIIPLLPHPAAKSLHKRQVRSARFVLVTTTRQNYGAIDRCLNSDLARKPRLTCA